MTRARYVGKGLQQSEIANQSAARLKQSAGR